MDNKQEYIICAAIERPFPRKCFNPYFNNDIINIELGYRHVDIIHRFKYVSHSPSKQGFYTSKGRFVSRDEAGIIAFNAGQISEIKKLFSEDLY